MNKLIIAFFVFCSFQANAAFNFGDFIDGLFSNDKEYIETTQTIQFEDGTTVKEKVEDYLTFIAFIKSNTDHLRNSLDENQIATLEQKYYSPCRRYSNRFCQRDSDSYICRRYREAICDNVSKEMKEFSKKLAKEYNILQPSCKYSKWEIDGKKKKGKVVKATCRAADVYALIDTERDGDYISTSEDDITFKAGNKDVKIFFDSEPEMTSFLRKLYESLN